ncbi:putative tail spike protein [Klebsiella phage vB_KpnD_Opt-79]|uniref:Tail spike protein n=1 Tax=Escherichia phage vB_EcoD_Sadiya TaxID=2902684 RepID=A0AC61TRH8_9CAUD|nr:tail spike protein [Escherichia phage vB_EcoD_Opt-719]UGO52804.1 putative tail spike protein [Klebsiella phage vB_KpnD_Opt-79]UGV22558.1 putative tail protein [Escherichia phage vB_ EcoD_Phleasolo]UGV22726.1 tail spike protein [Escherichia phage vB_EcoD_Sadiya]
MAIYDAGTASLAADGTVTGVGTTWRQPLTLIRVGATMIFNTTPASIVTIAEIISDTEIRVFNDKGFTAPTGTQYSILAHDGITVQGLAQDVAETLRYYQSNETEVAAAVDAFNQFDADAFQQNVTNVNNQSQQVASDALQVSADKADVQSSLSQAEAARDAAGLSASNAASSAQSAESAAQSVSGALIGSFQSGVTIQSATQQVIDISSGIAVPYIWAGALPKTVPANSTPESTGGVSSSGWVPLSFADRNVDNLSILRGLVPLRDGERVYVSSHSGTSMLGGGWFYYDANDSTSTDDDGVVIVTTGNHRWKRDLSLIEGLSPMMFGALMNAPYIDGNTIQGTPYPKAPSMGAADLTGVSNDGVAMQKCYTASIKLNKKILIDRPIYIGTTRVNVSGERFSGQTIRIEGTATPRRCLIYTSGNGGFIVSPWGHNMFVKNIGFRNADADYNGSPLISGNDSGQGGGGKQYTIDNVEFYHYKYALSTLTFVSKISNVYMYDCTYGIGLSGNTSTALDSVWAHHCDVGFLWGYGINTTTLEPVAGGFPVMYVTATNIAADGCLTPHKIGGQLRSVNIVGAGVEGVNGDTVFDFSDYGGDDDQFGFDVKGFSCWIQSSMNTGVLRMIKLPANESRMPVGSIRFSDGYFKSDYALMIMENTISNPTAEGNSVHFGDDFRIINSQYTGSFSKSTLRSTKVGNVTYGESPVEARNSYNGTTLSAVHVTSGMDFNQVRTEDATLLLPYNRALDILLTTVGEESRYGSTFIAGELSLIPINKNGLGGQESGGIIQFSLSGSTKANVSSGIPWYNKIAKSTGSKSTSLDGVSITKYVTGGQTFLRILTPTASVSTFLCHLKLTYSGFAHFYDKRWQVRAI